MRVTTAERPGRVRRQGFTLIELLVVISIIALLVSILLPALGRAREQARAMLCATNMKGVGTAMAVYTTDYDGYFPNANYAEAEALTYPNGWSGFGVGVYRSPLKYLAYTSDYLPGFSDSSLTALSSAPRAEARGSVVEGGATPLLSLSRLPRAAPFPARSAARRGA